MKFIQHAYEPLSLETAQSPAPESGTGPDSQEMTFLFVNSQKGETPQDSRPSLRSHVMQQARSKRKWSTSRGVINDAEALPSRPKPRSRSSKSALRTLRTQVTADRLIRPSLAARSTGSSDDTLAATADTAKPTIPKTETSPAPLDDSAPQSSSANTLALRHDSKPRDAHSSFSNDWFFLNPYASLPIQLDAASRSMLDYYLRSLNECFVLAGRVQCSISHAWFVAAVASRAFMCSLLCAAATHLFALGRTQYDAVLHHESATMQELTSTLSDPILGVTDGNIAAVFNLLCVNEALLISPELQSSDTNLSTRRPMGKGVHSDGLRQMVRIRGGLLKLRHNPSLFSFLLWHATEHSVASFQPSPLFPDPDEIASVLESFTNSPCKSDTPKRLARLLLASGSPQRLVVAARNCIVATRQFDARLAEDPKAPSYRDICDFSGLLIQSLLRFLHLQIEFDPISEATATAMIMFLVRKSNDPLPMLDTLHFAATRWLAHALRYAPDADWDPDLRLWVSTIGAICARGSPEEVEIENAFVWACQVWDIRTLDQLREALHGVLWIRSRFDECVERLWTRWKDQILQR